MCAESGKPCRQSASGPSSPHARYANSTPFGVRRVLGRSHGVNIAGNVTCRRCDARHSGSTLRARVSSGYSCRSQPGGSQLLNVTFYGVRGSTPCPCEANLRYGGNTACVALEAPGRRPDRARPRHRPSLLGRDAAHRRQLPRHGARHPPALGSRAGPAVLRARRPARRAVRHLRARRRTTGSRSRMSSTISCARRTSRSACARPARRHPLPRRGSTPTSRSATPRSRCAPCRTSGRTNGYRVEMGGVERRVHQRPPAADGRQPRRRRRACSSCATAPTC